jgi:hypothetical protein
MISDDVDDLLEAFPLAQLHPDSHRRQWFRSQWLDRKPPTGVRGEGSPWRRWFEGERYLGLAYSNGRQKAEVGSGRTNGAKLDP